MQKSVECTEIGRGKLLTDSHASAVCGWCLLRQSYADENVVFARRPPECIQKHGGALLSRKPSSLSVDASEGWRSFDCTTGQDLESEEIT